MTDPLSPLRMPETNDADDLTRVDGQCARPVHSPTAANNEMESTMFEKRKSCALRPDAQAFDEIRIFTVPRYKTSGLSGDEWRIHAEAQFYRKGKLIFSEGASNMQYAAGLLYSWYVKACDDAKGYFAGDGITCDQEGCAEPATIRLRRLFDYCRDGHKSPVSDVSRYRHFCEKHKTRGDCGLDDADVNYTEEAMSLNELSSDPEPTTR